MKKDDLLKIEGMTEELADKVLEAYKGYIPKSRFDEVNEARKTAEALIVERDNQIAELKKSESATDELKKQIEALQEENAKGVEAMKAVKLESAITLALKDAGAKNIKAVRPFITANELNEDGTVKGLDDQIKSLKESEDSSFLFNAKVDNTKIAGASPVVGAKAGNGTITKEQFNKMSYKQRVELKTNDPDTYNTLTNNEV
jgi:hypothetical protein